MKHDILKYRDDVMKYIIKLQKQNKLNIISVVTYCMKLFINVRKMSGEEKKKIVIDILQEVENAISEKDIFEDEDIELIIDGIYHSFTNIFKKSKCC